MNEIYFDRGPVPAMFDPGAESMEPELRALLQAKRLTALVSIGRLIEAKEIAYLVAFLASPKSIAINGETIAAGGGMIGPINY